MTTRVADPAPSALTYLFADELLPRRRLPSRRRVPCRNGVVEIGQLHALVFAVALWDLREQGAVSLVVDTTTNWLGRARRQAAAAPTRADIDVETGCVEGLLAQQLRPDGGEPLGLPVADAVETSLFTLRVPEVDALVCAELERGGYVSRHADGDRCRDRSRAYAGFRFDCERIASLEPAFDELALAWNRFRKTETELAQQLVEDADAGFRRTILDAGPSGS